MNTLIMNMKKQQNSSFTYYQVQGVMENVVMIIDDIAGLLNEGLEEGGSQNLSYDELTLVTEKVCSFATEYSK